MMLSIAVRPHLKVSLALILPLCLIAVLFDPVAPHQVGAQLERVIIATPSIGFHEFPARLAIVKGFYREQGLDAIKPSMKATLSVTALLSGDVDYTIAIGSTMRAAVQGTPVKVVFGMTVKPLHVIIARPEIKSPKDLKGKVVGVESFGSTTDYLARVALKHFGLQPERDVTIITIGENPIRLAALQSATVHATPLDMAYALRAQKFGMVNLLYLGDITDLPLSGLAASDRKIRERPDQVRKAILGTMKGIKYFKDPANRADIMALMGSYLGVEETEARALYDLGLKAFSDTGIISASGVQLNIDQAKERLKLTKEIPHSQLVNWSFVRGMSPGS